MREGEKLHPDSPIITPKVPRKPFIRTVNIGDATRGAIRKAGFSWRPYVLRAFFDTQMMLAESKGYVMRDYRQFWMGHKGDIEHRYTLNKGMLPLSVVESFAYPLETAEINVKGTLAVLEAARLEDVESVVFSSSSAVYGDGHPLPLKEDLAPRPLSNYAVTKVAGEHFMKVYSEIYGIKTVSLRYFNVYGPRQNPESEYAAVIPKFIGALLRGEAPVIYGDGKQTRDFIYVKNYLAIRSWKEGFVKR